MRLNGEMGEEEEEEEIGVADKLVVGYALTSKKKKSFLQQKLLCLAQ
jgi:inositol-1,3,4-trisphosphate 5/6-kinase/inositol-tetrakisphosphate 1-kinase